LHSRNDNRKIPRIDQNKAMRETHTKLASKKIQSALLVNSLNPEQ